MNGAGYRAGHQPMSNWSEVVSFGRFVVSPAGLEPATFRLEGGTEWGGFTHKKSIWAGHRAGYHGRIDP